MLNNQQLIPDMMIKIIIFRLLYLDNSILEFSNFSFNVSSDDARAEKHATKIKRKTTNSKFEVIPLLPMSRDIVHHAITPIIPAMDIIHIFR